MHRSFIRLFPKGFSLSLIYSFVILGIQTVSLAEEVENRIEETPPPAAGRVIVIDPESGTIDPGAKTIPPQMRQQATQSAPSPEEFTYHKDGRVTVHFKEKFMKPLHGHLDEEGKMTLSHEQEVTE